MDFREDVRLNGASPKSEKFEIIYGLYSRALKRVYGEPQIVNDIELYKINGAYYAFCQPYGCGNYSRELYFAPTGNIGANHEFADMNTRVSLSMLDVIDGRDIFVMKKAEFDLKDGVPTFKLAENPTVISKFGLYNLANDETVKIQSNVNGMITKIDGNYVGLTSFEGKTLVPAGKSKFMYFTTDSKTGVQGLHMSEYVTDPYPKFIPTSEIIAKYPFIKREDVELVETAEETLEK